MRKIVLKGGIVAIGYGWGCKFWPCLCPLCRFDGYAFIMLGASLTTHFEPMHKLRAHSSYILKCLISPDCQQLATTSSDKSVRLWNLDNNFQLERTLVGHTR